MCLPQARLALVAVLLFYSLAGIQIESALQTETRALAGLGPDSHYSILSSPLIPTSVPWRQGAGHESTPAERAHVVAFLSHLQVPTASTAESQDEVTAEKESATDFHGGGNPDERISTEGTSENAVTATGAELAAAGILTEETTLVDLPFSLDELQPGQKFRNDYRPSRFIVDSLSLVFDLDHEITKVSSRILIRRSSTLHHADLVLDGNNLELLDITLNGRTWIESEKSAKSKTAGATAEKFFSLEDGRLVIPQTFLRRCNTEEIVIETTVIIRPISNLGLKGLFTSGQTLVTQCEPEGFRRITYFLDRPDVLTHFTVRLEAEKAKYPVLLSNGNKVDSGYLPGTRSRHYAVFEDPLPKPSYLFAIVAGNLGSIKAPFSTKSGRTVKIELFSEPSQVHKLEWAMESVKKSMQWDEKAFGREYDLEAFNVACVSDFNAGAMENKGLNIFNCNLLLADEKTSTDAEFEKVLAIVGHEYFHNWTGNRVTVRDWFQLTLKEGLTVYREQLFMSTMSSPSVQRVQDVSSLTSRQFAEDDSPMAHSIRPDSCLSVENFYTATVYDKGAEVVQMYHTLLGSKKFQDGMNLFFKRHDLQAATCDDFHSAMEDASGQFLGQLLRWYSQAGTPRLEVLKSSYDSERKTFDIAFRQHTPPNACQLNKLPQVIPIRLGLIGKLTKRDIQPSMVLVMTKAEQTFSIPNIEQDCIPSILRGLSAPVKLIYPGQTAEDLAFLMAYDVDPVNKWKASNALGIQIICERARLATSNPSIKFEPLPECYLKALRETLGQKKTDDALKALAFGLPDWSLLVQELRPVNPDALHKAIRSVNLQLAASLNTELLQLYDDITASGRHNIPSRDESSTRRLRNTLLRLLSERRDEEAARRAYEHFRQARNMTDKYAALLVLTNMESRRRDWAFSSFHADSMGDKLVLDKWFKAQAVSELPGQVERVAELLRHKDFSFKNPNRMQSLLLVFAASNKLHFHRQDGLGYKLMSDSVLEVDKLNPVAATRLAKTLVPWSDYDLARQKMMKEQLNRIIVQAKLSDNVREVVTKALGIKKNDE